MKVILSIGLGRLHFIPAVSSLRELLNDDIVAGVTVSQCLYECSSSKFASGILEKLTLVLGWISPWILRGVTTRFLNREIPSDWDYESCPISEVLTQVLLRLSCSCGISTDRVEAWGWQFYGWCSRRYIKDADIFHVRSGAGQGGAIRTARARGMKILVDHSIAYPQFLAEQVGQEFDESSLFWRNVMQDCNDADIVLVNSDFVRETFVQYGFPAEKLRVAYLGVEREFFGIRKKSSDFSRPLRLLFVGQFGIRKGGEYLVEAIRILEKRGIAVILDVVGSVALHCGQESENIIFHGSVAHVEVKDYLKQADLFVFPTLAEGCARSAMEAMAAGLCVLTTRECGTPIVDGETGFIVPSKDALALADKIEWLVQNRSAVECVGAAAAKIVEQHYTWDIYASNVFGVYRYMLGHD